MDARAQQEPPRPWQVAAVVLFYMGAALVMVFVNKAVLLSSPDLPLLFLFIQLILAVILLHLSALFTSKVEIPKLDMYTAKKLTPLILVNVIGLVFNILCLRGVDASFFQIARGLVLPLTILVSSLNTHTLPSSRVIIAAAAVAVGFFLGVSPSSVAALSASSPSSLAIFYGVLSSIFIAVHSVLIKASLPHAGNSTIQLAYWQNLGSALFLAPVILLQGELYTLRELSNSITWNASVFVWGSIITGVFGFLLCVAGLLSIKVTSPITHMFSSAARSVIQTLLGVWIYGDLLTTNRAGSILVITLGAVYYTWVKHVESSALTPPSPPRADVEVQGALMKEVDEDSDEKLEHIALSSIYNKDDARS